MPISIAVYDHSIFQNHVQQAVHRWAVPLRKHGIAIRYVQRPSQATCDKLSYEKGVLVCTDKCAAGLGGWAKGYETKNGWRGKVVLCDSLVTRILPSYICHEIGHGLGASHAHSIATCMTPRPDILVTKPGKKGIRDVVKRLQKLDKRKR